MNQYILYGLISFHIVLGWDVISDYFKWLKEIPVRHSHENIIRMLLLIPSGIMFFVGSRLEWEFDLVIVFSMMGFYYITIFDGFYNLSRARYLRRKGLSKAANEYGFFDLGSKDKNDAATDKLLRKLPVWMEAAFKICGTITLITIYILNCKK